MATLMRYIVLQESDLTIRDLHNLVDRPQPAHDLDVPGLRWKAVSSAYKAAQLPARFGLLAALALDILSGSDLDAAGQAVHWLLPSRNASTATELSLTRFTRYSTGSPVVDAHDDAVLFIVTVPAVGDRSACRPEQLSDAAL
jgi:hypothetical protein